jgi:hypothetical protein
MENEIDLHDMHQEEHLWPTTDEPELDSPAEDYPENDGDSMTDAEADADTLASAGMGTDEDYGYFGGEDSYLDGSYEE